ncbi:MAG: hypothetical protein BAJALOKI2v1_200041 [Promethearchaeota archaeon]|nr:MAG: hypothetical protein BAJALOKI2v1_200041 [Candidatus Lokiarchaeota archaeon]
MKLTRIFYKIFSKISFKNQINRDRLNKFVKIKVLLSLKIKRNSKREFDIIVKKDE